MTIGTSDEKVLDMTHSEYMKRELAKGARGANQALVKCLRAGDGAGADRARMNRAEAMRQARLYAAK